MIKETENTIGRELYESKMNFFTQVVHEIKTPLTLIKVPLEEVLKHRRWDSETLGNLEIVQKNVERLLVLVGQLMDFRKIDSNGYKLTFTTVDVNERVEEVLEQFRPSCGKLEIVKILPEKHLINNLDSEALTKILSNLVSNAVKYARHTIKVYLREEVSSDGKRMMYLGVKDDGPGIPEEEQACIFDPFYQATGHAEAGFGVGLSLVKLLVDKHDGSVSVMNSPGCEIIVRIPMVEYAIPGRQVSEIVEYVQSDLAPANVSRDKMLIVEDTPEMLEFLIRNFDDDYSVISAEDGQQALDVLAEESFDIIISDVMMPRVDGFELLRRVRSDDIISHTPFILLSALDSVDNKIKGLENGADAYIPKPFDLSHLKATAAALIESRRRLFRHYASNPGFSYRDSNISNKDSHWLDKVNVIIREHLRDENFDVAALADALAMSRSNLQRKLKGLTGDAPNDYVRIIRLRTAAHLLKEGKHRVNEICYVVGFNNHSYFSKCFTKQFGVSPRDFAKK